MFSLNYNPGFDVVGEGGARQIVPVNPIRQNCDLASGLAPKPLVAILGPTGAGKSELALRIAGTFEGEIINYDSVQVYRGLNIGSAKLPESARGTVRHHLLDILDLQEELTAGAFAVRARLVLQDLVQRRRLPIFVGGTGFYLRALLDGLSPAPPRDESLRRRLMNIAGRRPSALHHLLRLRDPDAAERIHPNDYQKLIRALELTRLTRRSLTEAHAAPRQGLTGYSVLKLALRPPRAELCQRLDRRSALMFQQGLLEEVKELLRAGASPTVKPLLSLGYKQAVAVLTGSMTLSQGVAECQIKTRQYAKRQMTWFRGETGVDWLDGFGDDPGIQERARQRVSQFLSGSE